MAASLHERALRCLAQREHSRVELARKLGGLGSEDEVNTELDRLAELGLLSDARFADAYVRAKASRFGASRLRMELSRRGVPPEPPARPRPQDNVQNAPRAQTMRR